MRINIVNKEIAPGPPFDYELVDYIPAYTPFILYALWLKSQRYFWATPEDWAIARSALAEQGAYFLMPGTIDIVNAVDRVYTLLDERLIGNERSVTGTGTALDPFVYDPPLEQAAQFLDPTEGTVTFYLDHQLRGLQNISDGQTSIFFSEDRNIHDQLAAILEALTTEGGLDADMLAQLVQIVALLG